MNPNDTYKRRHFLCEHCHSETFALQWNYDPPPICCEHPMTEGSRSSSTVQIITDTVPGGFVVENGFDQPTRFDSKSEHRAALAAKGFRIADRGEVLGRRS